MTNLSFIRTLLKYLRLDAEIDDYEKIYAQIQKDVIFRGTNLWVLIFAIFVASVGLNVNSTAVIIGAMLISPLLGPIIGAGFSIATYNWPLFKTSLKNFSFAVLAALITSSLYFFISPLYEARSELLARTSPTIYDVLIALFGGFAGIIATSSKQKGNVIPGVAIATALMPPLCTCGYGIGTGQWNFFAGAFYLFVINSFFIALASMIVTRLLKFPLHVEKANFHTINRIVAIFTIIIIIPSIYLGYLFIQQESFRIQAEKFVSQIITYKGNYLLRHEINESNRLIKLVFAGRELHSDELKDLKLLALGYDIDTSKIVLQYGIYVSGSSVSEQIMNYEMTLNRLQRLLEEKMHQLDSINNIHQIGHSLLNESSVFYPQIEQMSYFRAYNFSKDTSRVLHYVIVGTDKSMTSSDKAMFEKWLSNRLQTTDLKVFYDITENR